MWIVRDDKGNMIAKLSEGALVKVVGKETKPTTKNYKIGGVVNGWELVEDCKLTILDCHIYLWKGSFIYKDE